MPASVEELASSLVREYLSRKGLKQTLAKMDEELPRTADSISNRATLARTVHIEKMMKRNKERGSPLQTMIEVIVKYLLERSGNGLSSTAVHSSHLSTAEEQQHKTSLTDETNVANGSPLPSHTGSNDLVRVRESNLSSGKRRRSRGVSSGENPPIRVEITPRKISTVVTSPPVGETGRQRSLSLGEPSFNRATITDLQGSARGMESQRHSFRPKRMAEWELDQHQIQNIDERAEDLVKNEMVEINSTGLEERRHANGIGEKSLLGAGGHRSMRTWHSTGSAGMAKQNEMKTNEAQGHGDLLCEDLEDFDLSGGVLMDRDSRIATRQLRNNIVGQPIPLETAKMLRELLFGCAKGPSFNSEWRRQNFTFCKLPGLEYGLVQHKGGPCGVLACVQACLLKYLLFNSSRSGAECLQPSPEEQNVALISAMSDILWKLGGKKEKAVVALPAPHMQHSIRGPSRSYTPDQLTERVILYSFTDHSTLKKFITTHIYTFQSERSCGCILFLLSALLSKGLESIKDDMDDPHSSLIGTHNYCTQEMVNLLLTGHAVSNVFDGNVSLDSGSKHKYVLKGIPEQSEIGFLSLFESYGSCVVGSHYKEPVYPLWVVCSESHFIVLFSTEKTLLSDWQLEQMFDLFYFDGLANQDQEIRLTIDNTTHKSEEKSQMTNRECCDLIPPLELCIQTKWKKAAVDWNNSEPML